MMPDERTPRLRRLTPYAVAVVVTFALYPFAGFLNRNRAELTELVPLVAYAAISVVAGLAVLIAIAFLRPRVSVDRVAVGVAVFLAAFFGFHVLFSENPTEEQRVPQLLLWAVFTVLLVVLAIRFVRLAPVRTFILVLGLALTVLPLGEYLAWRFNSDPDLDTASKASAVAVPAEIESSPNVYYFLLDEYARNDTMQSVLGHDNSDFAVDLKERDFVVVERAHSPFQHTVLSMSSVLDMGYVVTEPGDTTAGEVRYGNRLRGDNATVEYFKALGYDYLYLSPAIFDWSQCDREFADYCIEPHGTGWNLEEMELSLLDLTPVGSLDIGREAITDPLYAMKQIQQHQGRFSEPFFLYAHILSPHSPARYSADCELRTRFAYHSIPVKTETDRRNYVQDVVCLNENVLAAVDEIQEADPDAIIILASDHGSKFIPDTYKRLEEWRPEALREEFGSLLAMYVPEACRRSVAELTNTINTFRVVAGCLENRAPTLVDDRVFLWPSEGPGPQEIDDPSVLDPLP